MFNEIDCKPWHAKPQSLQGFIKKTCAYHGRAVFQKEKHQASCMCKMNNHFHCLFPHFAPSICMLQSQPAHCPRLAGRPSYQPLGLLLQRSNIELQNVALHAQVELICLLPQTISPKMGKAFVAVINSCWLPGHAHGGTQGPITTDATTWLCHPNSPFQKLQGVQYRSQAAMLANLPCLSRHTPKRLQTFNSELCA